MQILIDIDEEDYNIVKKQVADGITNPLKICIANGTPIPDNATNGDVIKAMFSKAGIEIRNITVYVIFDMHSNVISFDLDWWNAPYQRGGKG